MLNSYLGGLNKYNPYAIENVKNEDFIDTLRKLEKLSMSEHSSNKKVRTEIAREQIETQIKASKSISQIFDVYWNSHIRTMISFAYFSKRVKEYYSDAHYKITLEWIGKIIYDDLDKQYYFIPILFKLDKPIIVHSDDVKESWSKTELDGIGRLQFIAAEDISIELQTIKEI